MERPLIGTIVVIKFPFSDLRNFKLRPALVVGVAEYGDLIVCQVTSKAYSSKTAIELNPEDSNGMLRQSFIRPDKIFTADTTLVVKGLGKIQDHKLGQVKKHLNALFEL